MASTGKLPGPSELRRLQEQGLTAEEIAEMFGTRPQAVYNRRSSARLARDYSVRPASQFMPWPLMRPEHQRSATAVNLRVAHAIENDQGGITDVIRDAIERWKGQLEYNNFVISYHPETSKNFFSREGGFFARPRRAGDSPGIMQMPAEDEQPPSAEKMAQWAEMWRRVPLGENL